MSNTYTARPVISRTKHIAGLVITALVVIAMLVVSHKVTCTPIDVSDPATVSDARVAQYIADGYTGRANDGGEYLYAEGC